MPHNSRPPMKAYAAMNRNARLRAAGVPAILSPREAWFLSGGVIGRPDGYQPDRPAFPTARIAKEVPDCEHFLADYLAEFPPA